MDRQVVHSLQTAQSTFSGPVYYTAMSFRSFVHVDTQSLPSAALTRTEPEYSRILTLALTDHTTEDFSPV